MAEFTVDLPLRFRYDKELFVEKWTCDTGTAATFYRGQPVILDASLDTLNVRPYTSSPALVAGDICVGIALEHKVVLTTDVEASTVIEVAGPGSIVGFVNASFTNADVGKAVAYTGATLAAVAIAGAAASCPLGYLLRVEDSYAYVKLLDRPLILSGF